MAKHLAEAYPNGDYFDQPLYTQYFLPILTMCTDIAEFRHFRGDGLPKQYFTSRSSTVNATEDLYHSFVTWIGGGLKLKHKFAEEEGAKWAAEAVRDDARDEELGVVTELAWYYVSEIDPGYVRRASTPEY